MIHPDPRTQGNAIAAHHRSSLLLIVRGPKGKVVTEQLHDESRVLVALLVERVELGDGVVEGLLGQLARGVRLLLHFVQEDGIVEREAEADRVGRRKLGCPIGRRLVRLLRLVGLVSLLLGLGELGEVAEVVCRAGGF